ncbi:patatin-like phospholipase family protein [Mangrovicella endophytica]|uniref:patatin-like phospholipase family protein n=1 Tax=Mangrovicella endophytica TaxID=2066697 RepID=UPI000C9EA951|nr:patatin-like phospholipase family protein [Mangrovicella endophytica]
MGEVAQESPPRIGLALSGGGIRAAVFHLGVLQHLAGAGLLESVSHISTVSGGSLVTGAIFACSGNRWPTSSEFLETVYPSIRTTLTTGDLLSFRALGIGGILRENIRIASHRAHVLSGLLRRRWGVEMKISDLPGTPVWYINTTCVETGKNWRFSQRSMGDWRFGTHYSPGVAVSDAIAASAAVPYAIGALTLTLPLHGWWETDPATKEPIKEIKLPRRKVHLWDGGAYENMALEALYKPTGGLQGCDILIGSDASGPLGEPKSMLRSLATGRLASPRLFDIASDQIRSLRSRMLMKAIEGKEIEGYLIRLGAPARKFDRKLAEAGEYLTDEASKTCLYYPTTLTKIETSDFDLIARHGSETARLTIGTYSTNPHLRSRTIAHPLHNQQEP